MTKHSMLNGFSPLPNVLRRFLRTESYRYRTHTKRSPYCAINCFVPRCPARKVNRVLVFRSSNTAIIPIPIFKHRQQVKEEKRLDTYKTISKINATRNTNRQKFPENATFVKKYSARPMRCQQRAYGINGWKCPITRKNQEILPTK